MSKLFRKITVVFVLISLVFSQTGLFYLGSSWSPKEAKAGIIPDPQGTIGLKEGWNLISPSDETLSSEYLSGCEVVSGPWYWDSVAYKYKTTNELRPMNAYWVRVDNDCTLEIGSTGDGDRDKKNTALSPGWNLISSTTNYNWEQIKGSCQLSVSWLFDATGSDYSMLPPGANLEPFKGYWVKVESSCVITEPVIIMDSLIDDLLAIDDSFYCFLSQGSPSDSCDLARIIDINGADHCRYYGEAICGKNASGYFEWNCGTRHEDPAPGDYTPSDPNYLCTDKEGWKKAEQNDSEENQSALKLDLCNITGSMIAALLGSFAEDFTGEVIVGLFGEDLAKKVQGLVDFYFWLEAKGIDLTSVVNDPDFFAKYLGDFIEGGVDVLKDMAPDLIKNFVIEFSLTLELDPGVAQELGNFSAYISSDAIAGTLSDALNSMDSLGNYLFQYAKESSSPVVQKLLQAEKLVNFIKAGLSLDAEATRSQILQAIDSLTSATIERFKRETGLSDQELNDIVGFVKYMINSGITLKDVLQKTKVEIEISWQSYASANGITLQKGIEVIQKISYDIAAEAVNKLVDLVSLSVPDIDGKMIQTAIDDQLIEKTIRFARYLLFEKGLNLADLSLAIEGDGFSAELSASGIDIDIDSQVFVEQAIDFISSQATQFLQNELKINPDLAKYIIDFAQYNIVTQGENLDAFINFNISEFITSFEFYIASRGRQILVDIATDFVAPYIEEALGGIDPEILGEVARFAKFLMETKNISIEEFSTYALDRVEELLVEFSAKTIGKITGIRTDILQRIFKIIVNQNLVQDIVHLDLISIVKKLLIVVEINGNFACPTDLVSAVCTLLNGNNWEDCSVGTLNFTNGTQPHEVNLYDPSIRAASVGICTVPNIYISILGEPIIKGINIKVGPIAYRGNKLRLDMPTSNKITNWGDGSEKSSLYEAKRGDGLSHIYSSSGNKTISAKCRFWLNIDLFSFHWPTVTQNTSKSISAP